MSFQSRIVQLLRKSPRTYDAVRGLSRALGARDEIYHRLSAWADRRTAVRFLQVGSNDGMANDPIREFIVGSSWQGVVVEPLPHLFARLVRNYAHCPGVTPVQCAVGYGLGERATLYRIRTDRLRGLPVWADQIASFKKEHVLKHLPGSVGEADIEEVIVPVRTLDDLASDHGLLGCDLLHLDIEGFEANLLGSADLTRLRPGLIVFERVHLSPQESAMLEAKLRGANYRVETVGCDALAFLDEG